MKNDLPKRLGAAALRAAILFLTFNVLTLLSRVIFKANIFDDTMLSPKAMGAWLTVYQFLIFESTVFAFHRHREDGRRAFLDRYADGGMAGIFKDTFSSAELYVECVIVVLLSLLIPQCYNQVGAAFFGEGAVGREALPIVLPILVALELVAHLSVRSAWSTDAPRLKTAKAAKEKSPMAKTVGTVGFTAMVYGAASLIIPWLLPFLVTLANFGGGGATFGYIAAAIAIILVSVVIVIFAYHALRAVSKRRKFVAQLKKYCAAQGLSLSEIRKPCLSLFTRQAGADFTLETGGEIFACKLMGSLFPGSPMVFADTGEGIRQDTLRMFRMDLLQVNTRLDFRMEDTPASRKIVIVLPTPKQIYASVEGSPPRPADTGEVLGEYTLYNATGFLGALERGHLGETRR